MKKQLTDQITGFVLLMALFVLAVVFIAIMVKLTLFIWNLIV